MNDTLQTYYDKHNGRLPTEPIPCEPKFASGGVVKNETPQNRATNAEVIRSDIKKEETQLLASELW